MGKRGVVERWLPRRVCRHDLRDLTEIEIKQALHTVIYGRLSDEQIVDILPADANVATFTKYKSYRNTLAHRFYGLTGGNPL